MGNKKAKSFKNFKKKVMRHFGGPKSSWKFYKSDNYVKGRGFLIAERCVGATSSVITRDEFDGEWEVTVRADGWPCIDIYGYSLKACKSAMIRRIMEHQAAQPRMAVLRTVFCEGLL